MSLEREEQDIPLDPPSVLFRGKKEERGKGGRREKGEKILILFFVDEQRDVYINSVLEFLHPKSAPPTAKFFCM